MDPLIPGLSYAGLVSPGWSPEGLSADTQVYIAVKEGVLVAFDRDKTAVWQWPDLNAHWQGVAAEHFWRRHGGTIRRSFASPPCELADAPSGDAAAPTWADTDRDVVQAMEDERQGVGDCITPPEDVAPPAEETPSRGGIYVASRASIPDRPEMWRRFRTAGYPIISSWIDEAGPGETVSYPELWARIHAEIRQADALVFYFASEDAPLKGAFVEVGMALALHKRVFVSLQGARWAQVGSWVWTPGVTLCADVVDALQQAVEVVEAQRQREAGVPGCTTPSSRDEVLPDLVLPPATAARMGAAIEQAEADRMSRRTGMPSFSPALRPSTEESPFFFWYVNHRGERALRRVRPSYVTWDTVTTYVPEPGWALVAFDLDRQAERTFRLDRMTRAPASEGTSIMWDPLHGGPW